MCSSMRRQHLLSPGCRNWCARSATMAPHEDDDDVTLRRTWVQSYEPYKISLMSRSSNHY
uniref:Uncharacterized protein n=1 Tax=Arundo donax TaxID=35708 RepID=A0A0A8Y250_ARUDO